MHIVRCLKGLGVPDNSTIKSKRASPNPLPCSVLADVFVLLTNVLIFNPNVEIIETSSWPLDGISTEYLGRDENGLPRMGRARSTLDGIRMEYLG